jgi:GTPase SAR1 family protein
MEIKVPVILVGNKVDKRSHFDEGEFKEFLTEIMKQF